MSDDFFSPFITKITLSESKSNAKPIFFVLLTNSSRLSEVGSGPLVHPSRLLLIVVTWQPISFNNLGAIFFAAPPPISTVISAAAS